MLAELGSAVTYLEGLVRGAREGTGSADRLAAWQLHFVKIFAGNELLELEHFVEPEHGGHRGADGESRQKHVTLGL